MRLRDKCQARVVGQAQRMKGLIDIHIPIKPPTDADEAYAQTHGAVTG